jgi:hypothetical protein
MPEAVTLEDVRYTRHLAGLVCSFVEREIIPWVEFEGLDLASVLAAIAAGCREVADELERDQPAS